MDRTITYPDYKNCILGIPNSILAHYGAETKHPGIESLISALDGNYKNVLFLIYDGMGMDMLSGLLPKRSFLRKNINSTITSVFPPTTVAACTTYYSGLSPFEHGWLGWALYFSEFDKQIEVFTGNEYFTREPSGQNNIGNAMMPFNSIYSKIHQISDGRVKTYSLYPTYIARPTEPETVLAYESFDEMLTKISGLCKADGGKFILAYYPQPDSTAHKTGCQSADTKALLDDINTKTRAFCHKLKDTLIIISADHGHIDIKKDVFLNEIPELDECLMRPPSIEPRAASIFVKPGMSKRFAELFDKHLGNDFLLFSKQKVLDIGLFGPGSMHPLFNDFVGDFMAVATGGTLLRYQIPGGPTPVKFLSHHAGLTAAEMLVPLIIIKSRKYGFFKRHYFNLF
ncbi:MAG: alkaline phosphatase family protein [Clostridiales bacterium]|nr:alkaline phosphatase family protein [Clostridiales bacterium]